MSSISINGRTYSLSTLSGTDGRDYARNGVTGAPLWDQFFTDLLAEVVIASGVQTVAYGAQYGFLRSTGTAWARVSGYAPSTDFTASVPATKGGTGITTLGTALQNLRTNAGVTATEWASVSVPVYAVITGNGLDTLSLNTWSQRTINAEQSDTSNIVSISGSAFTLQAGTYIIIAKSSGGAGANYTYSKLQMRLRNTTDSTTDGIGLSDRVSRPNGDGAHTSAFALQTVIAPTSAKVYQIQTYAGQAEGIGGASVGAGEIYVMVTIMKIL